MSATKFFWLWLVIATSASILANITHALISHPPSPIIAACAAVVPPLVLMFAAHGVGVLVKAKASGSAYYAALTMTVALAISAFVLSFGSLRDLAIRWAGYPPTVAWLWPLTLDVAITMSTTALLALTRPPKTLKRKRAPRATTPLVGSEIPPTLTLPTRNGVSV